jgi:hypothetical protein
MKKMIKIGFPRNKGFEKSLMKNIFLRKIQNFQNSLSQNPEVAGH